MTLLERFDALDHDDVYVSLLARLEKATDDILRGAGNEEDWITMFQQLRNREAEVLGL